LCGGEEKMMDITIAIDKLDKIGIEKVKEELTARGLSLKEINIIEGYLNITGTNEQKLQQALSLFEHSSTGKKGIEEMQFILKMTENASAHPPAIDLTLARGLNYYTGTIFEAKAPETVKIGSIGGGGRYDDLTGLFGVPHIPGVGISFGVDRIYDVMEELRLFPETVQEGTRVLFFNLGEEESKVAYQLMQALRQKGIPSEIFHEAAKFDRQFKYAEKKNIPYAILIGSKEVEQKTALVKDLRKGEQIPVTFDNLPGFLFI
ncbi:MAG: histidine--tRNA ligase, partial [Flavisolibacter sp.]